VSAASDPPAPTGATNANSQPVGGVTAASDLPGLTGATNQPASMTAASEPSGPTIAMGGDRRSDPLGQIGTSSGDPPHQHQSVTLEGLLGSLDSLLESSTFLHGRSTDGVEGWDNMFSLPAIIQSLKHELTDFVGSGIGPWTPEVNKSAISVLPDVSSHGAVGNLEQDSKPHGHTMIPSHH
jgi:hypothetical protein